MEGFMISYLVFIAVLGAYALFRIYYVDSICHRAIEHVHSISDLTEQSKYLSKIDIHSTFRWRNIFSLTKWGIKDPMPDIADYFHD